MLVVSRKKGESILIGEDIEITIIKVEEGAVKVAISAPKSVTILRKELYKEVTEENKLALIDNYDILKNLKK